MLLHHGEDTRLVHILSCYLSVFRFLFSFSRRILQRCAEHCAEIFSFNFFDKFEIDI